MATTDTSITVTIGGEVTLPLFVQALTGLNDLIRVLSKDLGGESADWVVENLESGSAVAIVRGLGEDADSITSTTSSVIEAVRVVERGAARILPPQVARAARKLTHVVDGVVPFLILTSGEEEVTIFTSEKGQGREQERVAAFGSVTGVVRTLSRSRGLYFTVADESYCRIVACRFGAELSATMADTMRDLWDRRAVVEGTVIRDRRTGRPIKVLDVQSVSAAPKSSPGAFVRARGVIEVTYDAEPPESTIRRLRDAS
jgi:hypothetical protein